MKTGDHVVQDLPWRWNTQGRIFIIGGLGYMFDAWDVTLAGFVLPLLGDDWGLNKLQLGLFGTSGLIGMAIGAFTWGTIADMLGRKRAFTVTLLAFAIFSAVAAVAPNYPILLAARFIAGLGLGGCVPVDYAMVAEFTPRKVRGRALTALDMWWPIGATLCGLASSLMLPLHSWRLMLGVMVIPALLVFWVRRSVPESPLFLVRKGRDAEARKVIGDLIERTGAEVGEWELPPPEEPGKVTPATFLARFRDVWRFDWKVTLAAWLLMMTVMLEYYGVLTWLPSILKAQGFGEYGAFLTTTGMTAVGIVAALGAAFLVDLFGRKWVIIVSALVGAVTMVLFARTLGVSGQAQWWILFYGLASEVVIPAMYCYIPELYPTLLRGTGFGWASTASRVVAGLVPLIFGTWLWPVLGLTNTFILIGVLIVVALVWLVIVGPETRGRELDTIGDSSTVTAGTRSAG
ncbi:MAG TPA: MFS transporter [Streptosporangiaceae bacterium]|jgi:putative MFS transporter